MDASGHLRTYRTLALIAWRYWWRRPLELGGALLSVCVAAAVATAGLVAHGAIGGAVLAAGCAAGLAALLTYSGWLRARAEARGVESRLLNAIGLPTAVLSLASRLEVGFLTALGAVPGAFIGAGVGAEYVARLGSGAVEGPLNASGVEEWGLLVGAGAAALLLAWALERALAAANAALKRSPGLPLWLRVAAGQLTRGRGRAGATVAALVITVAAVVGLRGAEGATVRSLSAWMDGAVTWDVQVAGGKEGEGRAGLTPAALRALSARPGVAEVSPERRAVVGSQGRDVLLVALDRGLESTRERLRVVTGVGLEPGAVTVTEGDVVALSVPMARRLAVGVGDSLPLTTSTGERAFKVVALVEDQAGAGDLYLDLVAYASAFGDHAIDTIKVRLDEGVDAAGVASDLALHGTYASVATAAQYRDAVLRAAGSSYGVARYLAFGALILAFLGMVVAATRAALRPHGERLLFSALGAPGWALRRSVALEVGFGLVVALALGALTGALLGDCLSGGRPFAPLLGALNGGVAAAALAAATCALLLARAAKLQHR